MNAIHPMPSRFVWAYNLVYSVMYCVIYSAAACFSPLAFSAELPTAEPAIVVRALSENNVSLQDITPSGTVGKVFFAATLMHAPVPQICSLLQDYSAYPRFMPNTAQVKVTPVGDLTLLDVTLHLPLGKVKKYRLQMTPEVTPQSCKLAWKLLPSDGLKPEETIADTRGYWDIAPHPEHSGQSVVKYFVYTDPGPVPLGLGWIVDSMSKDSIPKMLDALRLKLR